jgi:hypothetical protein
MEFSGKPHKTLLRPLGQRTCEELTPLYLRLGFVVPLRRSSINLLLADTVGIPGLPKKRRDRELPHRTKSRTVSPVKSNSVNLNLIFLIYVFDAVLDLPFL